MFITEMNQIYKLAKDSKTYKFLHNNITAIKFVQYALVVSVTHTTCGVSKPLGT